MFFFPTLGAPIVISIIHFSFYRSAGRERIPYRTHCSYIARALQTRLNSALLRWICL